MQTMKKPRLSQSALVWAALGSSAIGALPAQIAAQSVSAESGDSSQIAEVLVTATRQGSTSLQSTPLAVSVLTGDELARSGITNISQLAQYTPSLSFVENPLGGQIYIRGIGTNNVFAGSDPDVTTQIDGVYIARPYAQLSDFIDVGQVEVLRGPQGTLYGRNAVGGVVNITSKAPSDRFTADAAETVGNYGLTQTQAYVSGPLVAGVLNGSVAVNYVHHDPYLENLTPGSPGLANANHGGLRAQLAWRPIDWLEATTRADYNQWGENQTGLVKLLTPFSAAPIATSLIGNDYDIATNRPETLAQTIGGVSEDLSFHISPALTLKSISAYRYSSFSQTNEADGTEIVILNGYHRDLAEQISQEFDLQGHLDNLDFVSGLYYFTERDKGVQIASAPTSVETPPTRAVTSVATPDAHTRSKAAFAELNYKVVPTVSLIAGARYTEEAKSLAQYLARFSYAMAPVIGAPIGVPFIANDEIRSHAFTPKGAVDWQVSRDLLLYASVTRGFKSGGNNASASSLVGYSYLPEKITSYEAGVKSEWLDRQLRLNLTAFRYHYSDLQVQSYVGSGLISIGNAATARIQGLEFESVLKPLPGLQFTANATYLDARYTSFPDYAVSAGIIPLVASSPQYHPATKAYDATGNTLNSAPKHTYSASGQYTHDLFTGAAYARLEYYWQSRVLLDPTNISVLSQPSYGLVNVELGYTTARKLWDFELLGENLADKGYVSTIAMQPYGFAVGVPGTPRTVAFRVSRHW
jgi:iron complex outermembrane receptor protein